MFQTYQQQKPLINLRAFEFLELLKQITLEFFYNKYIVLRWLHFTAKLFVNPFWIQAKLAAFLINRMKLFKNDKKR